MLLVTTDAARGIRLSRGPLLGLFAVTTLSLGANITLLRANAKPYRSNSATIRAQLTAMELERSHVRGILRACRPALRARELAFCALA